MDLQNPRLMSFLLSQIQNLPRFIYIRPTTSNNNPSQLHINKASDNPNICYLTWTKATDTRIYLIQQISEQPKNTELINYLLSSAQKTEKWHNRYRHIL